MKNAALAATKRERKTCPKLMRFTPSVMGRLNRMAAARNEDVTEIIERGTLSELDRCESETKGEMSRMEMLRQIAAARGTTIDEVLKEQLQRLQQPALAGLEELAG